TLARKFYLCSPLLSGGITLFARGGAVAGETLFIHGASGSVGTSAIQLAKRAGLKVIGSAGTPEGLDLIRGEGADHAVNHRQPGYLDEVRRVAGDGPDLILEMLADANLAADMDLAAMHGRIVIIGCRGEVTINPRIAMAKELDVRGFMIWNVPEDLRHAIMQDILAAAHEGTIRPIVGREMPLTQAAAAQVAVLENGNSGKIVLIP
ncbi:zinc-binding dehydrogenase, partial [Pseudooceanicola sp.]|uniref:zinc-binding dehydrogenase n=1 Tax=Pseudooceanicola sp. TaxID=1914328 RepID=UPI002632ECAF